MYKIWSWLRFYFGCLAFCSSCSSRGQCGWRNAVAAYQVFGKKISSGEVWVVEVYSWGNRIEPSPQHGEWNRRYICPVKVFFLVKILL